MILKHIHKIYNKFLVISAIVLLFGGLYVYFSNDLNVQAATPLSTGSLSSSSQNSTPNSSIKDKISQDTDFLASLTSLNKIQINTAIFSDPIFNSLKDNTVIIEPGVPGRHNPFAPVESNQATVIDNQVASVVTNQPTQITDKSVLLSGSVGSTTGITDTYFEYGETETLGKVTLGAKQSLIGTFVYAVKDLKSHTKYFFNAVAKINGALNRGEIISFTTN